MILDRVERRHGRRDLFNHVIETFESQTGR